MLKVLRIQEVHLLNRKRVLFFIVLCFWGLNYFNSNAFASPISAHVLYISSYNENFESVPLQLEGIKSILEPQDITVDAEYMDTKRFETVENELLFYNMLQYKLTHLLSYDAIIVGDDAALQFAMKYQNDLFPSTPIVFLGVNNIPRALRANENPYITGIIEEMYLKDNINFALTINPDAKNVVAIVDNTYTGIGDAIQFYQNKKHFSNLDFDDINTSELSLEELKEAFAKIGSDTIVLYLSMYEDKDKVLYTIPEASRIISEYIKVPVYRAEVGGVGDGIFGGKMVSYEEAGRLAGDMVLRCMEGESIQSIEMVQTSPSHYIVDNNLLEEYKINESELPDGTILINRKLSFYESNKQFVHTVILIMFILTVFSIVLVIDNIKRRRAEKSLKESKEALSNTYDELVATEEELRAQFEVTQEHLEKIEVLNETNEFLANHDYLTKLPNRMNFVSKLQKLIDNGRKGAILLLDLDNFKNINDILGHTYGDQVLQEVAQRLIHISNEQTYVCRFGGDEFLILLENVYQRQTIINYIQLLQTEFESSFVLMNRENYIQFSIGISIFPEDCTEVNQLIMYADTAMYKAKNQGKNNYVFYHDEMQEELRSKSEIETILRQALKEDGFVLHYQPQVSVETGEIACFEALLRLKSHQISPGKFIGVAEESGLIIEIGRWVTKDVIRQLSEWKAKGMKPKTISLNFSSKQLRDYTYLDFLQEELFINEIEPRYIEIEITESCLLYGTELALEFLNKLKHIGVKIALDDFGTGFSSINYLTYIPAGKVKLDKSLSDKFLELDNSEVINSIISLAHSLNMDITAEGIEEFYQYEKLAKGECDYIQGYLFSRPLPVAELEQIYNDNLLDKVLNYEL